ncbi:protein-disulfide reductase DsbD family protein [Flavobacterium johnsoniae]|uniref:Cytochrome c biogenesis protein, transmembrane region n=1 Tax=Flavobacterium johnsoniae (strain ATCC 17061 / DSM 2064 / JCM 8514 / BCRC 14874 / CCUG 350202 / NBRC 14942 / NCIMB 11054 / UW101) TaxID=376686 RepID=A5FHZ7_FLAJ1|nr:cytochrome c biogenesis protein CcdA [Flavobacterium johnsoniae]ABQ05167.1 cytochrome c biogenesis protein, transmembrane region [Flavobacterium johnsoniae UW101]OXG00214.1 thiol:disulfide interchange protein [Flavobacterium johnsoniae UW101]WQG83030.1 cytochrome c biogenesis protein CcdA [Flavobacterium johnsoniae UW101]SHL65273.1 thiol:disulfide interchange protein DsbD [Flavobacterium johnsoniae]
MNFNQNHRAILSRSIWNKITAFLLLFFFTLAGNAQILEPVKWTSKIEKKGNNAVLIFDGTIEKDWHMYSQFTPDGGPLALEISFKNQKGNYELVGKAKEGKTRTAYNDVFGVDETFFEGKAHIEQEIKIINPNLKTVDVDFDFQVCKEVCINSSKKFSIAVPSTFKIDEALPVVSEAKLDETKTAALAVDTIKKETAAAEDQTVKAENEAKEDIPAPAPARSLWSIFFIAFLSGFAALLTPCVFPMIPMTVSFFTKQSKSRAKGIRNAIIYGLSIIAIYVILGLIVTKIFGADALNALSTDVWFNLIFFVILIIFATSFLGAFEIMLPNSWANKADQQADKGGLIGILFMALALAIVSFSCTGPIVGTLLVEAASNGGIAPVVGMLGFSSALALPFMLFAMFPGWLNSLPKSGGWLNTVKVVLGFLELALAFKFLSNADLVLQLHFLEREVFIAIWIAIFGALTLYLFGKITLPHDSPTHHISVGRLYLGLLTLVFTMYLIPGLWGAPLKLISAFPPPPQYSESPFGVGGSGNGAVSSESIKGLPEGAELGPHGIMVFHDYEDGLAYAKEIKKPIMLDFTGYACVNCRKMENNVWSEPTILPILKNDVVLISLYVDDKRELPKEEQFVTKSADKIITVGDKWTDFMISKYKTNTQPLYVITDLEGNNLNASKPTISYVSADEYLHWLKEGISNFK